MSVNLRAALLGAAVAAIGFGWWWARSANAETRLTFLAVGQGDCAVLQHQGRTVLIDAGPSEAAAKWDILPKLRRLGVRDVDLVILTHPDLDHVAGVPRVLKSYPSARITIPKQFKTNDDWNRLLKEWRLPASRIEYLPEHARASIGALSLKIFCPTLQTDNDGSAFVKVAYGGATAVLSGDASAEAEAVAAPEGDWSAQVMKAGHHGSRTSTSWTWLKEVQPKFAVVSCGKDNRYNHPHQEVIDRLTAANVEIETTVDGDISFVVRDGKFVLDPK